MPRYDFLLETYDTERLKTLSVWSQFRDEDLRFRPEPRARTPHEQMVHQCVSEDIWLRNMLGIDLGAPALPAEETRVRLSPDVRRGRPANVSSGCAGCRTTGSRALPASSTSSAAGPGC